MGLTRTNESIELSDAVTSGTCTPTTSAELVPCNRAAQKEVELKGGGGETNITRERTRMWKRLTPSSSNESAASTFLKPLALPPLKKSMWGDDRSQKVVTRSPHLVTCG